MNKRFLVSFLIIGILVYIVPVSAIKIDCLWQCTNRTQPNDDDTLWDYTDAICNEAFTTAQNELGPTVPRGERRYAGQEFRGTWLGTGWSAWWHNALDYCVDRGLWRNATRNGAWPGQLTFGGANVVTFEVGAPPDLDIEELEFDGCNAGRVCIRGRAFAGVTWTMNSPFIYFEGMPDGVYDVQIHSESESFETDPQFNRDNGWNVSVSNGQYAVDSEKIDHLFYELETPTLTLSRSGKNFEGADALLDYLEDSDFFDRLGFSEIEKENSLNYVESNLPNKSHYFLTVLDRESIEDISNITVSDSSGMQLEVLRKYFAIYPSRVQVPARGDLVFPIIAPAQGPLVKEYGEIIVKPDMHVFWK